MITKIVALLFISILLASGLNSIVLSDNIIQNIQEGNSTITTKASISTIHIQESEEYVIISLDESESFLSETGRPMIPKISKTFSFPLGTTISAIEVAMEIQALSLEKKIHPSPQAIPLRKDVASQSLYQEPAFDTVIYESEGVYPEEPYVVHKGAGLQNGEQVLFLTVDCFAQYSPATDVIHLPQEIEITIEYEVPQTSRFTADEYDLLIITTDLFETELQRLVDHKNDIGMRTIMETVQNIYPRYDGRDDAEDVKLFIKDALEDWGIRYVLLAGGRKGQTLQWHVPTRRVNHDDGWETGYDSDLYFADIYDSQGNFSCWDSNNNGIFAEWSIHSEDIDIIDYYPNVYVGRLPFRYRFQVAPVVDKIIEYELHADDSWFKTGAVVSGNTYPPSRGGKPEFNEGELATGKTVAMLESAGFAMEKLWLSIPGSWNGPQDIIDMISKGKGFIHFAGHSNPAAWGNYRPYDDIYGEEYVNGLHIWDMHKFTNKGKYPIVVLGGCHSAQFNVTLAHMIPHIKQYGFLGYFFTSPHRFYYMEWVPVDLSSRFVLVPESGGIACMGHTGLGYGARDEHWRFFSYWIEPRFFEIYANQSYDYEHLGDIHSQAIIDYLNIVGGVNKIPSMPYERNIDRKTIEGWVLLGDPTLRVGGI